MSVAPTYALYASTLQEARQRIKAHREADPFPQLPPALLSSEHIKAYVKQTGMVYPFDPNTPGKLKAASYEINPGGNAYYWDDSGRKKQYSVADRGHVEIGPNSITFVELESEFALPDYIAVRFNLRIQHVHRGILLGTGPLVDPGFKGRLLIPLHNLTSEAYRIDAGDGLIWVEFTKTSRDAKSAVSLSESFIQTDREKTDRSVETYFEKANKNNPIQSSISKGIIDANRRARDAEAAARRAERTVRTFTIVGVLAIVGAGISIASLLTTITSNELTIQGQAADAKAGTAEAKAKAESAASDAKKAAEDVEKAVSPKGELGALKAQLEQTRGDVAALRSEVQRVTSLMVKPEPASGNSRRKPKRRKGRVR